MPSARRQHRLDTASSEQHNSLWSFAKTSTGLHEHRIERRLAAIFAADGWATRGFQSKTRPGRCASWRSVEQLA